MVDLGKWWSIFLMGAFPFTIGLTHLVVDLILGFRIEFPLGVMVGAFCTTIMATVFWLKQTDE